MPAPFSGRHLFSGSLGPFLCCLHAGIVSLTIVPRRRPLRTWEQGFRLVVHDAVPYSPFTQTPLTFTYDSVRQVIPSYSESCRYIWVFQ